MAGSKIPRSSLVIHLKAEHAQLNRKSSISGLQIGSFQGRSFHNRWSRGTKTLGTRVVMHLKARHAQFNRKSDIFGHVFGPNRNFLGCSFRDRWSWVTKIVDKRVRRLVKTRTCSPTETASIGAILVPRALRFFWSHGRRTIKNYIE